MSDLEDVAVSLNIRPRNISKNKNELYLGSGIQHHRYSMGRWCVLFENYVSVTTMLSRCVDGVEFSFSCVFEFEFAKLQTLNCDVSQCNPNRWSKYRVRLHLFRFLVIFVISTIYM